MRKDLSRWNYRLAEEGDLSNKYKQNYFQMYQTANTSIYNFCKQM